mgnify:CR=1 FL=1
MCITLMKDGIDMVDIKDSRIKLRDVFEEDGKQKAVVQVQLNKNKRRVYILTVFKDKFGCDVIRLRCNWHEKDGAHKIDYRIPMEDFQGE